MTATDRHRPRALLVGGTGFAGRHLARALQDRFAVTAVGRGADLRALADGGAEVVVNLAAITTVREAEADRAAAEAVMVAGLEALLGALEAAGFRGRFLQVSSSEVYGHPEILPLSESRTPDPRNAYARAKLAAEAVCAQRAGAMEIVIARPFTHIGPGQDERFAVAGWARQLARIEHGLQAPEIAVGALGATRDLTDVRDVVRAYDILLEQGQPGTIYNVCSGRETAMREVLDTLIALSGQAVQVTPDPTRMRAAEQQRLRGDAGRLEAATGWQPQISLAQTLSDVLEDARARVAQESP